VKKIILVVAAGLALALAALPAQAETVALRDGMHGHAAFAANDRMHVLRGWPRGPRPHHRHWR